MQYKQIVRVAYLENTMSLFMSVFRLFVVRKEVKKKDAEVRVKEEYSETQMEGNSTL